MLAGLRVYVALHKNLGTEKVADQTTVEYHSPRKRQSLPPQRFCQGQDAGWFGRSGRIAVLTLTPTPSGEGKSPEQWRRRPTLLHIPMVVVLFHRHRTWQLSEFAAS